MYLRLGRLAEAVDDYDAALKINPDDAQSLFGRGIAKLRRGHMASAGADLAAAKAIRPRIAEKFFGYGIFSPLIITTTASKMPWYEYSAARLGQSTDSEKAAFNKRD